MFDFPKDAMSFLHRVGRAGRFGKSGIGKFDIILILVISFVREKDAFLASKISPYIEKQEKLDAVFSRKRSLRKITRNFSSDSEESD